MPDHTLLDWRLDTAIANTPNVNFTPRYFPIPPMPMTVVMELDDKALAMVKGDSLLQKVLSEECKDAFDILLPAIVQKLQALDNACATVGLEKYAETRTSTYNSIELHIDSTRHYAQKKVMERWESLQREQQKYKSASFRFTLKVIKGAAELVGGAIAIAAAIPTGGATLAVAIVGGYRGCMDLAMLLEEAYASADEVRRTLEADLKSLKATYAASHAKGVAREIGASVVNEVLKVPVPGGAANVGKLEDQAKAWEAKLGHLRLIAHKLSRELTAVLDKADQLEELYRHKPGTRDTVKVAAIAEKVNIMLTEGFDVRRQGIRGGKLRIDEAHTMAERGLQAHKKVVIEIKALQDGRSSAVDVADKLIALVTEGALFGAGLATSPPDFSKLKDVKDFASDATDVIKPFYETVAEMVPAVKKAEEAVTQGLGKKLEDIRITQAKHLRAT
jgi:hypothetical protein